MTRMNVNQLVFKICASHLIKQGKRSIRIPPDALPDSHGECAYRSDDGLMCALGILMTDEEAKKLEGASAADIGVYDTINGNYPGVDRFLLTRLQGIHDTIPEKHWMESLLEFGEQLGYDTKFLTEVSNG